MKKFALCLLLLLTSHAVYATCGGGGGGGGGGLPRGGGGGGFGSSSSRGLGNDAEVYQVPWKALQATDAAPAGQLVLYWFTVTPKEQKGSELQNSRPLALAAAHCVGLGIVGADNSALREKYKVAAEISTVVLAGQDGAELGRVLGKYGRPADREEVEKLLKESTKRQEKAANEQLDGAKALAEKGDKDGAIALYTKVWEQRCLIDGPAKKAAKALKKLGVAIPDELSALRPDQRPATEKAIEHAVALGLQAENDLHLKAALKYYKAAARLDPADPTPLRYLGELYRHHIGDWQLARATFQKILAMPADPMAKAVALHGLGKMTIHDGDFAKGLQLFEDSIATYPLALTYRNLAVYWNSEGKADKAYGYVQQAMALDPDDGFNQIFAATYLVTLGKQEEAAKIATTNESVLAASYNLAAIWSMLGEKDKALALLKRHFYTFERTAAVRRKEMQEARVDIVFASIKQDPVFVALTALADGMGMK